jgi:ubiquinone/menaquinone biosynthesis C-methylase UbiE
MSGWHAIDVGCGGGDGSFELARRVGPRGRVHGLDLDKDQLSMVEAEAQERGFDNISLLVADVGQPWPVDSADVAYARFILTHLPNPLAALKHAFDVLKPGGIVAVEDVDMGGHFCFPPSDAFDRYYEYYLQAAKLRGGDPFIGLRLDVLLGAAGFSNVHSSLVQPYGRVGDVKIIAELTMRAMADGLKSAGARPDHTFGSIAS